MHLELLPPEDNGRVSLRVENIGAVAIGIQTFNTKGLGRARSVPPRRYAVVEYLPGIGEYMLMQEDDSSVWRTETNRQRLQRAINEQIGNSGRLTMPTVCNLMHDRQACRILEAWANNPRNGTLARQLGDRMREIGLGLYAAHVDNYDGSVWDMAEDDLETWWGENLITMFGDWRAGLAPVLHDPDFLRNICANPDDDAARLAYADWLEENPDCWGREQLAEFIRLQIAGGDAKRQEDLLADCGGFWTGNLPGVYKVTGKQTAEPGRVVMVRLRSIFGVDVELTWRRGFVDEASCGLRAWYSRKVGPLIVAKQPVTKYTERAIWRPRGTPPRPSTGREPRYQLFFGAVTFFNEVITIEDSRWLPLEFDTRDKDHAKPMFFHTQEACAQKCNELALAWARRAAAKL